MASSNLLRNWSYKEAEKRLQQNIKEAILQTAKNIRAKKYKKIENYGIF